MAAIKEGDRVKVVYEPKKNLKEPLCYPYMDGWTGRVANYYNDDEVVIEVDLDCLPKATADVHAEAGRRLRGKLLENLSQEGVKKLTEEEMNFTPHMVVLLTAADLQKA